jgi:CheY-like chemotaxis protein
MIPRPRPADPAAQGGAGRAEVLGVAELVTTVVGEQDLPVRVLVVDDSPDIRLMLRILLERDGLFEVVGEGGDGKAAIVSAEELQPDLVILDRQMPVLGGIEAIPEIRRRSPVSEIILYTAAADSKLEGLALSAGAIGLLEKQNVAAGLSEGVARMLIRRWSDPAAEMEVKVGPVPSVVARAWVDNTTLIIAAIRAHPEIVEAAIGGPVAEHILDLFDALLGSWGTVAADTDTFLWMGRLRPDQMHFLVEEWARLDAMGDDTIAALGCSWSGPEGARFFPALTEGVLAAMARHDQTRQLGERLSARGWGSAS